MDAKKPRPDTGTPLEIQAKVGSLLALLGTLKAAADDFAARSDPKGSLASLGPRPEDAETAAAYLLELGFTADAGRLPREVEHIRTMVIKLCASDRAFQNPEERASLVKIYGPLPISDDPAGQSRLQETGKLAVIGAAHTLAKMLERLIGDVGQLAAKVATAENPPKKAQKGKPGRPPGTYKTSPSLDGEVAAAWRKGYEKGKWGTAMEFVAKMPAGLKAKVVKAVGSDNIDYLVGYIEDAKHRERGRRNRRAKGRTTPRQVP